MFFFFWTLFAFDLAFCLVLSSPHGSLPALEDKLGCNPREVLDAVFLGSLLRRDSKDTTLEFLLRLQAWRSCTSHLFFGDSLSILYLLD